MKSTQKGLVLSKPMDWKKPQLLISKTKNHNDDYIIVVSSGENDSDTFQGTVVYATKASGRYIGEICNELSKGRFEYYPHSIELSNE